MKTDDYGGNMDYHERYIWAMIGFGLALLALFAVLI